MAVRIIRCPKCGAQMQVDTEKPFAFCTQCGTKVVRRNGTPQSPMQPAQPQRPQVQYGAPMQRPAPAKKKNGAKTAVIACTALALVCALVFVSILFVVPAIRNKQAYDQAASLAEDGKYGEAAKAFDDLDDYKDAKEQARENHLKAAQEAEAKGDSALAAAEYAKAEQSGADDGAKTTQRTGTAARNTGEVITFGRYEQDNDTTNGKEPIEWIVLEKKNGKALVISKYALDCQPYNTEFGEVTWETCTLRMWMNDEFLNTAFSAEEQTHIPTTIVTADTDQDYSTKLSRETQDKVFLMNYTEAENYFSTNEDRRCAPTKYANEHGAVAIRDVETADGKAACNWWLRSTGYYSGDPLYVGYGGWFGDGYSTNVGIRPALWIEIN